MRNTLEIPENKVAEKYKRVMQASFGTNSLRLYGPTI